MSTQLQQARDALADGNQDLAQALVAAVLQAEPQNGEAWYLLSEATEGERKLIFLKKANKLDPDNPEIQARLNELTGVSPTPEPEPEPEPAPEPEPVAEQEDTSPWDDFDMAALADDEGDGEPIDTSAITVDETLVAPPDPEPEDDSPAVAVASTSAMATNETKAVSKDEDEDEKEAAGLDMNYIGMIGSAVLAIIFLLMAIWTAMGNF